MLPLSDGVPARPDGVPARRFPVVTVALILAKLRGVVDLPDLPGHEPGLVFLCVWFLHQLIEVNFELFSASANGGSVAFTLTSAGSSPACWQRGSSPAWDESRPDIITPICEFRADPEKTLPRLPPCAIALANIATVSIDFTRRVSRGELPVLPADEPITPAGTARA